MKYTFNNQYKTLTITTEYDTATYKGDKAVELYKQFLNKYDEEEEAFKEATETANNNKF